MEQTGKYTIKIQNFEGPLDLLFHLIEKNKMDIYDIQITEIAEQYMDYLNTMKELDLEITSEFLVMASALLLIKSRMLLPEASKDTEDQEDLKDELINRLVQYKRYKEFTKDMKDREIYYAQMFYKPREIFKIMPVKVLNRDYFPELIPSIYKRVCERNLRRVNPDKIAVENFIIKDKVTIRSKIREIVKTLITKAKFKFSEIFAHDKSSRSEVSAALMAVLELAKAKRVKLDQKQIFGEIIVKKIKKVKG